MQHYSDVIVILLVIFIVFFLRAFKARVRLAQRSRVMPPPTRAKIVLDAWHDLWIEMCLPRR